MKMLQKIKRILVTGGTGFLGSNLCDRLVSEGHEVICLDNLFTSDRHNIHHLLEAHNFDFIRHDVTYPIRLEVDMIYHLACPASPVHYQHNPIKTIKTAFLGTMNMLGLAKRCGATMLHTSTSEVYGEPTAGHHPQQESYRGNVNPIGVRACYDEGKRAAETLCFDYIRQHQLDVRIVRIVRIFNTYGPRMHPYDGRVVSNFIMQALAGEPLTIYGEGTQSRSFCFVDDLLDVILLMANRKTPSGERPFSGPVNIGNPSEFTMLELADLILELTGSLSQKEFKPLPNDDPLQRKPDISLAKEKLDWQPSVDLKFGLV
jgi:UDP-glucuronate decarboxylase